MRCFSDPYCIRRREWYYKKTVRFAINIEYRRKIGVPAGWYDWRHFNVWNLSGASVHTIPKPRRVFLQELSSGKIEAVILG